MMHNLSRVAGVQIWLKPEHLQRTGSFKIRGAYTRLSELESSSTVVAASAGNHAQGVALAASLLGHRSTIFMPRTASLPKVQATRDYGAEVILDGDTVDDCIHAAKAWATESGAVFVSPFDHPSVIAGQGTIGLELLDEVPDLATVIVAVGGGGLLGGIAAAIKQTRPNVLIIGAVAEGSPSMVESHRAGRPVVVQPRTIADGIALASPSALTLAHVTAFVDSLVLVSDDDISRAGLMLLERAKAVVEPAGAAAMAVALAEADSFEGPVAVVLGGGNVDPLLLAKQIDYGLELSDRYLSLEIVMADTPGSLAGLTAEVAELGLNVLEVTHRRSGARLPYGDVALFLTVETRDSAHQDEVISLLMKRGFDVRRVR